MEEEEEEIKDLIFPSRNYVINPKTGNKVRLHGITGKRTIKEHKEKIESKIANQVFQEISTSLPSELQQIILVDYNLSIKDRYLLCLQGIPFANEKEEIRFWYENTTGHLVSLEEFFTYVSYGIVAKSKILMIACLKTCPPIYDLSPEQLLSLWHQIDYYYFSELNDSLSSYLSEKERDQINEIIQEHKVKALDNLDTIEHLSVVGLILELFSLIPVMKEILEPIKKRIEEIKNIR